MHNINLLFPHQLFQDHEMFRNACPVYLIEEHLFFHEFRFHKIKLAYHRASMRAYFKFLKEKGIDVTYISIQDERSDIRKLVHWLSRSGTQKISFIDPSDNWLEKRIKETSAHKEMEWEEYESPLFLNTRADLSAFFGKDKKFYFQTAFYKEQRKKRNILMDALGEPLGGQWSFDADNRKKYPKHKIPPPIHFPEADRHWKEAITYVEHHFPDNPGSLPQVPIFPYTREAAWEWWENFLEQRFHEFGAYEDAIVQNAHFLHHGILTPMMNTGLLSPRELLHTSIDFGIRHDVPMNSIEGFVRQILGWREFIRGMYEFHGVRERNSNFWGAERKIPEAFYTGNSGIPPVDDAIRKVLSTSYNHHIERLMILGNFMLLCQFDPNEVYRWFMELYIDAYDWVMVPNVYGMSQFADGGSFATKPYISGSNYILKMSDHKKGPWTEIWDGLFWNFIHTHQDVFRGNHRMSMMYHSWNRMSELKRTEHLRNAEKYLAGLDQ